MSTFDCAQFQGWLDAGGAATGEVSPAAAAHAAGCLDCASQLAAERAVSALFAAPVAALPDATSVAAGLADRVMARVALTPQSAPVPAPAIATPLAADALPWWIRVAARPEAAAACLLAGLAVLFSPQLLGFAHTAPQWGAAALAAFTMAGSALLAPLAGRIGGDPWVGAAVALAFLPVVGLLAYALYLLGMQVARVRLVPAGLRGRRA